MRRHLWWIVPAVLLLLPLVWPSGCWIGSVPREVVLKVLNSASAVPVSGASVTFEGRSVGQTDLSGTCRWTQQFGAGGSPGLFMRTGNWYIDGEVTVTTPDGRHHALWLSEHVKDPRRSLWNERPVEVRLSLPH